MFITNYWVKYFFIFFFKIFYFLGEDKSVKYRKLGWAFSSACAEIIADVLLCPMEAVISIYKLTLKFF